MNERKKLKLILGSLTWFMIYMLVMAILILINLFTGTWNRLLDFGLYIGNVVAFGLSFYIIAKGKTIPFPLIRTIGVFIMLVNAWGIVNFLFLK